jgi:hypothetical protein
MNRRTRFAERALWALPVVVVVLLSLPGMRFPYLFDDFDFLARAQGFQWRHLLPDAQTIYWRPLSRELYFGLLYSLGTTGAAVGHALNLAMIVFLTLIVGDFVAKVAGRTAGFLASAMFATFPYVPFLAAWISASQDLFAMSFVVLALRSRLARRFNLAGLFLALALLSKETSASIIPVLACFDFLIARKPYRLRDGWFLYGTIGIAWMALHPATRLVLSGSLSAATGGALGNAGAGLVASVRQGLLTVLEIPADPVALGQVALEGWPLRAVAAALLLPGVWLAFRRRPAESGDAAASPPLRAGLLGLSLTLLPLLLTTFAVRRFSPYYACLPFIGIALIAGAFTSRRGAAAGLASLAACLILGTFSLASAVDPGTPTVRNLAPAAAALREAEAGLKELHPRLPARATAYVSVQSHGPSSLHVHMHRFQVLRIWYRDAGIVTLTADRWRRAQGAEYLFWIDPAFSVFEIDVKTLSARGFRSAPDRIAYEKVLRRYAIGQAATGGTGVDHAVWILTRMDRRVPELRAYDWRLSAALLIANGRTSDAAMLLRGVPAFPRDVALNYVMTTLAEFTPRVDVDNAMLSAFGLSPLDYGANRSLMLGFERNGWREPAVRYAKRVRILSDADLDARRIIDAWGAEGNPLELTPRVPVNE